MVWGQAIAFEVNLGQEWLRPRSGIVLVAVSLQPTVSFLVRIQKSFQLCTQGRRGWVPAAALAHQKLATDLLNAIRIRFLGHPFRDG